MPDTPDIQSVVEAAERAAASGDYATAEVRLREAARLQEASLGPHHPDLANTLNNLGVVCEITGKPEDAEQCLREAWTIATAVLPPDHPFVATSRKNLEDFCAARGKAIDGPPPRPAEPPPPPARPSPPPAAAVEQPAPRAPDTKRRPGPAPTANAAPTHAPPEAPRAVPRGTPRRAAPQRRSRSLAIGVVIAVGALVVLVTITRWFRSSEEVRSVAASPSVSSPERPGPAAPSGEPGRAGAPRGAAPGGGRASGAPPTPPSAPSTPPAREPARAPSSAPPAGTESRPARSSAAGSVVVADARLCRELSTSGREWQCVSPSLPAAPGPFFFYTRIKSPVDTTIEHRWYRDDHLHQVVELRIRANMGAGYRTYSRNTISGERAGDWRVELRSQSGELLREERFVVR
jgi:hypothetical protein